jgi:putative endonuclease
MKYVYLIENLSHPGKRYIGISDNFNQLSKDHNSGKSPHTAKYKPWRTVVVVRFDDNRKANAFEKHLKSGFGHAIASSFQDKTFTKLPKCGQAP